MVTPSEPPSPTSNGGAPAPPPGSTARAATDSSGWVWGAAPDLLIGCGLGYMILMPLLLVAADSLGLSAWPASLAIFLALAVSGPHYGATLVRVYEERNERKRYAVFTVWITLVLIALMVASVYEMWIGSVLLTLYVSWAPWHFAGQNYGLALIFLRRRGVAIEPLTKRLFYASFVLSALISILPLHSEQRRVSYALEVAGRSETYHVLRLGLPTDWVELALAVCFAAYAACLLQVAVSLGRRARRLGDLLPAGLLVATQALWYTLPRILEGATTYSMQMVVLTSVWISAAHSLQYLWITSYFARRESPGFRYSGYLVKTTLAGSAIFFVPALLLAPSLLGGVPYAIGLASLIAAFVNLHHFVLDGAIWKLRDGRVARALLQRPRPEPERVGVPVEARSGLGWGRMLILTAGVCGIAVHVFDLYQHRLVFEHPELEHAAKRQAARRMGWVGRESPDAYVYLAQRRLEAGDDDGALVDYLRAVELYPREDDLRRIGLLHERNGRIEQALEANGQILELGADNARALLRRARLCSDLVASSPDSGRAAWQGCSVEALGRLLALSPGHHEGSLLLARIQHERGQTEDAVRVLQDALPHAQAYDQKREVLLEIQRLQRLGPRRLEPERLEPQSLE